MLVVIGSRGWNTWTKGFFPINKSDWDLQGTLEDLQALVKRLGNVIACYPTSPIKYMIRRSGNYPKIEFEVSDLVPSTKYLHELMVKHPKIAPSMDVTLDDTNIILAAPCREVLFLTKRSTIYWNVHWEKTITHLSLMKAYVRTKPFNKHLLKYYDMRLKENEIKFGKKKRINLAKKNSEFFKQSDKALNRIFVHDSIHEAIKFFYRPMYETLKSDKNKAIIDVRKWNDANTIDRIRTVQEEGSVIALERYIIPDLINHGKVPTMSEARSHYIRALRLLVTKLTSGWFREYIINNWSEVNVPVPDYVGKFESALIKGNLEWNPEWLAKQELTPKLHLAYGKINQIMI